MHNIHEGPLLKRLRIRLFGLTAREQEENARELAQIRAEARRRQENEDLEDEAFLARIASCSLCYGDGWITDRMADYLLLQNDEERSLFRQRDGDPTGRMVCPRCRQRWRLE